MARRTMTVKEWRAEGRRRFGDDPLDWRFVCVNCGEEQTPRDFIEAGMTDLEDWGRRVHFSCIGRWVKGRGCDWTLGGLLRMHTLEVNGTPSFEFAEAP